MTDMSYDDFMQLSEHDLVPHLNDFSVLFAQQFSREKLNHLCRVADAARHIRRTSAGADFLAGLLKHYSVLNFFVQPSSRTFLSFCTAESMLGMRRLSVRDINISSIAKGESLSDSIHTFISYVDLVVMRHPEDDSGVDAFWTTLKSHRRLTLKGEKCPIPIISGGSGKKQHPTQSLLDIYTLERAFKETGGIDGKTIMLVGDLKRGRTVRSLSYMMKQYKDVSLIFCAPEEYQMESDILKFLDEHEISYKFANSINEAVAEADAVYMTRIQDEWDSEKKTDGSHTAAKEDFIFTMENLKQMKEHAALLHPLPKRDEIEKEIDYCDDERVYYWRQERNGMWMRVALIAWLFKVDEEILNYKLHNRL